MRRNPMLKTSGGESARGLVTEIKTGNRPLRTTALTLTAAENRVLALVALAKSNKEIAGELAISAATVKRHLENILRKLGLRNRVEAAIYAFLATVCPLGLNSGCALQMWHKERAAAQPTWAD